MSQIETRQHLLIDADDTLWENNIYFEQAFDEFVAFLGHSSMSPAQVRVMLDEIELANIRIHGYGAANFARNLAQCFEHLAERPIDARDLRTVRSFAERILEQPIELIEGVEATLAYLSSRHDLTLFTKGHLEEQRLKIDRSGLGPYFGHTAIVREKNTEAYATLARIARSIPRVPGWSAIARNRISTPLSPLASRLFMSRIPVRGASSGKKSKTSLSAS